MNSAEYKDVRMRLLFEPSNVLAFMALAINGMLLFSALWLFSLNSLWAYVLSQFVFALHFNHCYLIVHEAGHQSLFSSRNANVIVGHIASIFAFIPFFTRRHEHNAHHLWSGTFKEPSTERALRTFANLQKRPRLVQFLNFCWRIWLPIFAINEHVKVWISTFKFSNSKSAFARKNLFSGIFLIFAYAAIGFTLESVIALYKMLPALVAYFVIIEFLNLPHHLDSKILPREKPISIWQQEECTKSFEALPWRLSFLLTFNFNLHIGHHYYPNLPWHELPDLQKKLEQMNPQYSQLQSEFSWHFEARKQPIQIAFKEYIDFQIENAKKTG